LPLDRPRGLHPRGPAGHRHRRHLQRDLLPGLLRVHDRPRIRDRGAGPVGRHRGQPHHPVGRTGAAAPLGGRGLRVPAAGLRRHPADLGLHRQVRGVRRGGGQRGLVAGAHRRPGQRGDRLHLLQAHRPHVLRRADRRHRRRPAVGPDLVRGRGRSRRHAGTGHHALAGPRAGPERDAVPPVTVTGAAPSTATGPLVPGAPADLDARLRAGLEAVQRRLEEVVDHEDPFIAAANRYLIDAGGKRFRPLLTLLCAEVGSGANDRVVDAAVAVELTHLASLYHDDVMDEATLRRGVPSVNVAYDTSTAILVGDLLFGTASAVVARLGPDAVLRQARTFVRLCSGQIRDDRQPGPADDPVEYYIGVLADKTGSLIATAAAYGAEFGGCDPDLVETLTAFGEQLGVVFQLADDLLDISSEAESSGKTPGTDLREGKATLPVLYARASTD